MQTYAICAENAQCMQIYGIEKYAETNLYAVYLHMWHNFPEHKQIIYVSVSIIYANKYIKNMNKDRTWQYICIYMQIAAAWGLCVSLREEGLREARRRGAAGRLRAKG